MCIWFTESQMIDFYIRPLIADLEPVLLIWMLVTYVLYRLYQKITLFIFRKLQLNLKIELRNYLTHKGWKISYYKFISRNVENCNILISSLETIIFYCSKALSYELLIILILFLGTIFILLSMSYWAYFHKLLFNFDIFKSQIFINYINHFNTSIANVFFYFFVYIIIVTFVFIISATILSNLFIFLVDCIFPLIITKKMTIKDTSDFPISFIKKAIEELEEFDFSNSFEQRQIKKNLIVELIINAIDPFIKVDHGSRFICGTNVFFSLFAWNISNTARLDVIFRTNGLYKKMDELCANINIMNKPEEQSRIVQELKKCLKAIENRDLSEFDPVEFKILEDFNPSLPQLISFIIKIF